MVRINYFDLRRDTGQKVWKLNLIMQIITILFGLLFLIYNFTWNWFYGAFLSVILLFFLGVFLGLKWKNSMYRFPFYMNIMITAFRGFSLVEFYDQEGFNIISVFMVIYWIIGLVFLFYYFSYEFTPNQLSFFRRRDTVQTLHYGSSKYTEDYNDNTDYPDD